LLDVETLEIEQIKSLLETGNLPAPFSGGASTQPIVESTATPIIDEIGDVKVRIQPREDEESIADKNPIQDTPVDDDNKKE